MVLSTDCRPNVHVARLLIGVGSQERAIYVYCATRAGVESWGATSATGVGVRRAQVGGAPPFQLTACRRAAGLMAERPTASRLEQVKRLQLNGHHPAAHDEQWQDG
jgi:hypothetical protein